MTATPALVYHERVVHALTKSVTYSDPGIADGGLVKFDQALPKNGFITHSYVDVKTAFNAATTNVLTVGTNSTTTNDIVASGGVDETSATPQVVTGVGVLSTTADLPVYVKYTQTGVEATAGAADLVINFVIMGR
jgi:hypothetical protein